MKTLEQLIVEAKCRKGKAAGKTKNGAFWMALPEILIRNFGGDGIGNSSADCSVSLQLRHYRDGTVKAMTHYHSWHQNRGSTDRYESVKILPCTTVEDVIAELLSFSMSIGYDEEVSVYSSYYEKELTEALTGLGMAECLPSPDEDQVTNP